MCHQADTAPAFLFSVCRQFSRCEGCPYPAHGFLCWGGEDDCMRTRVKKLNEKELEHEDQSGFV